MFLRALIPNICIYGYRFENEGVSDNTGESVFQFLVRYGCIKSGKSKDLMLVTRLKVGDLRCSSNSFEFLRIHI